MDHVLHNILNLLHGKSEKLRSNSFHQIKKKIKINEMIDIYAKDSLVAKKFHSTQNHNSSTDFKTSLLRDDLFEDCVRPFCQD